jgi:uncharacterized glyoxalase superfamily protein PhnB
MKQNSPVKPIPEGYHTVTPYLIVKDAARLLEFLGNAFGAKILHKTLRPDGSIGHTEIQIGDSKIMLAECSEKFPAMSCSIFLYLVGVDEVHRRAITAGGKSIMEPSDQFYGDRMGGAIDPSGNQWWIATHIEDVSHEEIARRAAAQSKKT